MSPSQKSYRAYFFDPKQRILTADWIKADSDDAALAAAQSFNHAAKCEVWDGERLVAAIEAEQRRA